MVNSYAIVAIPSRDDYVWRLSSEKIPHLTLLFLGDKLENVNHVESYLGHVASTSLPRFGMDVERRGTLGDKSADVLFFGEHGRKKLEDVRSYLLEDPDIFKAHESTEQFPVWIPHMTMGYPDSPAKNKDDYLPTKWITFDRIALWTGLHEGVEFQLKDDTELSMSDRGAPFLEHYGVKGMRWGVIRDNVSKSVPGKVYNELYKPSQDAVVARKFQTKAKFGGVRAMSNAEMRQVINRMALEKQYRDLYGEHQLHDASVSAARRYGKRGAKWVGRFLRDVGADAAASWLKRPGSNASGRTSARAWDTGQQFGNVIQGSVVSPKAIGR